MINTLLKTKQTVFTTQQLQELFPTIKASSLAMALSRYKQVDKLFNPQRGIWTLPVFSQEELGCTLYPQGYISLETVLYDAGVIFQWYGASTRVVRINTRHKTFQDHTYYAFKIKDELFTNPLGVRVLDAIRKATPERALCDLIYLQHKPQIDNPDYFLNPQSLARLKELLPFYPQTVQHAISKLLGRQI